jgi:hypothetical protein
VPWRRPPGPARCTCQSAFYPRELDLARRRIVMTEAECAESDFREIGRRTCRET